MSSQPSGLSRKTRSDKDTKRKSTADAWVDLWMEFPRESQKTLIAVLQALDRQLDRAAIKTPPAAITEETTSHGDDQNAG